MSDKEQIIQVNEQAAKTAQCEYDEVKTSQETAESSEEPLSDIEQYLRTRPLILPYNEAIDFEYEVSVSTVCTPPLAIPATVIVGFALSGRDWLELEASEQWKWIQEFLSRKKQTRIPRQVVDQIKVVETAEKKVPFLHKLLHFGWGKKS